MSLWGHWLWVCVWESNVPACAGQFEILFVFRWSEHSQNHAGRQQGLSRAAAVWLWSGCLLPQRLLLSLDTVNWIWLFTRPFVGPGFCFVSTNFDVFFFLFNSVPSLVRICFLSLFLALALFLIIKHTHTHTRTHSFVFLPLQSLLFFFFFLPTPLLVKPSGLINHWWSQVSWGLGGKILIGCIPAPTPPHTHIHTLLTHTHTFCIPLTGPSFRFRIKVKPNSLPSPQSRPLLRRFLSRPRRSLPTGCRRASFN